MTEFKIKKFKSYVIEYKRTNATEKSDLDHLIDSLQQIETQKSYEITY